MKKLLAKSVLAVVAASALLPCRAQVAPPVFNPPAGSYSRPVSLQMTANSGATIYYTTDGSAPTVNSSIYSGPITISAGTTRVQAFALLGESGSSTTTSGTYTVAATTSSTQLQTSGSPLILPGALTLTATVNPRASGGAAPSGNITFYSNNSNKLGTAPLKIVPSSQAWTGNVSLGTPLSNPAGLASVVLTKGAQPVLVSAQSPVVAGTVLPNVSLYKLSPGGNTLNAYTYTNGNQTITDAVVAGYFLQPASSSKQSFLVHEYYQYEVFDGSTTADGSSLNLNPPVFSYSGSNCDCSQPDSEALSVADFNNDGYSDLGVLIQPYNDFYSFYGGVAAIAINSGSSQPGTFNNLIEVTPPADISDSAVFCPVAIATGNFLSTKGTQLAVLASTPQSTCANTVDGPFFVYLFAYDAANSTVNEIGTPLALPDDNAATLAAADLNNDGISDLIIGESIPSGTEAPSTGGLLTALSAGDGSFKTPSALLAVPAPPVGYAFNDFNADGHIDVAYTSPDGYSILMGDGKGNFSNRSDHSTDLSSPPAGITSADYNGDTLADLAVVPGSTAASNSNLDIELNSASSQAVLPLGGQALAAGSYSLTAAFAGDSNFAVSTSPAVNQTVSQTGPVITWVPTESTLQYGMPLGSAQLNATASVPGTFTYTPASGTVPPLGNTTVTAAFAPTDSFDYAPAAASVSISVVAAPAVADVSAAESTVTAGQQSTITLTVNPYPAPITATATLTFTPAPPNTAQDPAVVFSNSETTQAVTINPGTTNSTNDFQFQAGSTAGTVTVTIQLTLANGQNITPSSLQPVVVTVPASPPSISSATLTRSGQSIQVSIIALSSTRDMNEAHFHFTPVSGKSLAASDVTVQLTSVFQNWYSSSTSEQYGTNFSYTQPFTLSGDATDIQSVSVTLANSAGTSEAATAQ